MGKDTIQLQDQDKAEALGIQDVEAAIRQAFPGAKLVVEYGLDSFHASARFDEWELRVILSGGRAKDRKIHIRLRETWKNERRHRMPISTVVTSGDQAILAIREARAHIMGVVQVLEQALTGKKARKFRGVGDLLREHDEDD